MVNHVMRHSIDPSTSFANDTMTLQRGSSFNVVDESSMGAGLGINGKFGAEALQVNLRGMSTQFGNFDDSDGDGEESEEDADEFDGCKGDVGGARAGVGKLVNCERRY